MFIDKREPFAVGKVPDTSANAKVLMAKDMITSFNGTPVKYADQVIEIAKANPYKTIDAIVMRDEKQVPVKIRLNKEGKLGVFAASLGVGKPGKIRHL